MAPHRRMLLALILGLGLGVLARAVLPAPTLDAIVDYVAQPIAQIFLRLLFVLVVPLLFSALVVGISDLDLSPTWAWWSWASRSTTSASTR